jgi:hypothetical protein
MRWLALGLVALGACGDASSEKATPPREFSSPTEASAALIEAAEKFDERALIQILGSEGKALVTSKDEVADRKNSVGFAAEARQHQRIEMDSSGTSAILSVGASDWPLPIPLVKDGDAWHFDAEAGAREILARRIGENELDAIAVCRGYVEAQREYARTRHNGSRVNQYAQHIVSTPGKRDGLAWRDPDGSWRGPVGEVIAQAIAEGYKARPKDRPQPFHGYYFKVLKGQGPAAPLGEIDFVVEGAMIGGFALVAAPAEYLVTGVKTFIVSHDGIVYEKDFGADSLKSFNSMERYNPDSTWTPVTTN